MDDTQLREELETLRREFKALDRARRTRSTAWRLVVGVAVLVVGGAALANPVITTFQADSPALAAEVNGNFAQLAAFSVPSGAVLFFDGNACPTGWTVYANGQGRALVGRPSNGTLGRAFGGALNADNETAHGHSTQGAGSHTHSGITNGFNSYTDPTTSNTNYNLTAGYQTQFHMRDNLAINAVGDHTHGVNGTLGSSVLPYVYLTPCRKD